VDARGEPVEVVDADGNVVEVVDRAVMRAGNLRHRSVGVVVRRRADGAVLAHRRAAWKDVWPGRWDLAFGGVCAVGEDELETAVRELAEEAGIDVAPDGLRRLGSGSYEDDDVAAVGTLFEVDHDGPFVFADGEVEATEWVPASQLWSWLESHPHCPDTAHLLRTLGGRWPER
jgi:8-oxo-dGTP pyrophosphatase MutT (NUDIX family)